MFKKVKVTHAWTHDLKPTGMPTKNWRGCFRSQILVPLRSRVKTLRKAVVRLTGTVLRTGWTLTA